MGVSCPQGEVKGFSSCVSQSPTGRRRSPTYLSGGGKFSVHVPEKKKKKEKTTLLTLDNFESIRVIESIQLVTQNAAVGARVC